MASAAGHAGRSLAPDIRRLDHSAPTGLLRTVYRSHLHLTWVAAARGYESNLFMKRSASAAVSKTASYATRPRMICLARRVCVWMPAFLSQATISSRSSVTERPVSRVTSIVCLITAALLFVEPIAFVVRQVGGPIRPRPPHCAGLSRRKRTGLAAKAWAVVALATIRATRRTGRLPAQPPPHRARSALRQPMRFRCSGRS